MVGMYAILHDYTGHTLFKGKTLCTMSNRELGEIYRDGIIYLSIFHDRYDPNESIRLYTLKFRGSPAPMHVCEECSLARYRTLES